MRLFLQVTGERPLSRVGVSGGQYVVLPGRCVARKSSTTFPTEAVSRAA